MARRIQRKDLKKPDDFVDVGARILGWVNDHRVTLGIALAGALVLLFGVMLVVHLRRSADVEAWRPLLDAVPVRALPAEASQANPLEMLGRQDPAVWVDAQRIRQVAESGEEEGPRLVAGLALAGELLAQGDGAAAEARYRAYLAADPRQDAAGRLVAQEGLGYALERQNRRTEAAQAFAAIAEIDQGAYKALALYHQGRLAALDGRADEARRLLLEAKGIENPQPRDIGARIEGWLRRTELEGTPVEGPPAATPATPVEGPPAAPPVAEPAPAGAEAVPAAAPVDSVPVAPEAPQADDEPAAP
ncbi:MAG: hypothetical protein GYA57_00425 [Myxococcales bacterium]|nr:hypothetical protein [Myxococcales bacterium]